jgi:AraC family transcriptional regulator of adaptative response/methylated-DNA-[protein]-cysteine methyltransferase
METAHRLPPPPVLYRALVDRDASYEGVFLAAIRTTRIFCRPTCSARKPLSENVEYFATASEALHAGYRPCKRCRPLERDAAAPETVRRLLDAVERAPDGRVAEKHLEDLGIDPSTARRQFRRAFGMTFQAYQRARRMGMALQEIREGGTVAAAAASGGYQSSSGFREAFARTFGAPPTGTDPAACLRARWIDTPLGAMLALAGDRGLVLLEFVERRGLERELERVRRRLRGGAVVPGDHPVLGLVEDQLRRYFEGTLREFTLPLDLRGSAFEKAVWEALCRIPYGQTRSYAQTAEEIGHPGASRAVGRANGANQVAIVVPCHRVVRADGSLCGYGGGMWRKQRLLELEGAAAPSGAGKLFW